MLDSSGLFSFLTRKSRNIPSPMNRGFAAGAAAGCEYSPFLNSWFLYIQKKSACHANNAKNEKGDGSIYARNLLSLFK
jgi:hypothetical protein